VKFIGAFILPNRIYVDKRTKGNFYATIAKANQRVTGGKDVARNVSTTHRVLPLSPDEQAHLLASVNSYLGFMRHYKTYKLRKRMLCRMSARLDRYMRPASQYTKMKSQFKK
jgi:hypothetical protein